MALLGYPQAKCILHIHTISALQRCWENRKMSAIYVTDSLPEQSDAALTPQYCVIMGVEQTLITQLVASSSLFNADLQIFQFDMNPSGFLHFTTTWVVRASLQNTVIIP